MDSRDLDSLIATIFNPCKNMVTEFLGTHKLKSFDTLYDQLSLYLN